MWHLDENVQVLPFAPSLWQNLRWLPEGCFCLGRELDESRKEHAHFPPFIHYWRVTKSTGELARRVRSSFRGRLGVGLVELEVILSSRQELDVGFVDNGGPLEWCSF